MKRIFSIFLAILLFASMAAAEEAQEDSETPEGQEIVLQVRRDNPEDLTVASSTVMDGKFFTEMWGNNAADVDVRKLLHGYSLTEWNSADGSYQIDPSVVSGFTGMDNPDGSFTYFISLCTDLYFSDGTPITAKDYAFTILLYACPQVREIGGGTDTFDFIQGMKAFRAGETHTISGVRIINEKSFSVTVSADYRPYFYELAALTVVPYPISVIAPGCSVKDDGNGIRISGDFTAKLLKKTILGENGYLTHPTVVSGPYVLDQYSGKQHTADFTINPYYKGNKDGVVPSIKHLHLVCLPEDQLAESLKSGKVDLLNKVVPASVIDEGIQAVSERDDLTMSNYTRTGLSFVAYNCERPSMSDIAVRQALAMCFDRDSFIAGMVGNYGMKVNGYYGIGQWMFRLVNGSVTLNKEMTDEETEAWEKLTLDGVHVYPFDPVSAADLLERSGWTLNADGIREKDGVQLVLKIDVLEGSQTAELLTPYFVEPLGSIGVKLTVEEKSASDMLSLYYRQTERDCDMFYLATNFTEIFDPAVTFSTADDAHGMDNRCGLKDKKLEKLAADMRSTEPGDVLGYCTKWVAFQEYFSEVLPLLPVYSNVYFDFYTITLQDYDISENQTWAQAIVGAKLGDYTEYAPEETEDEFIVEP